MSRPSKPAAKRVEVAYWLPGKGSQRKVVAESKLEALLAKLDDQGASNVLVRDAEGC